MDKGSYELWVPTDNDPGAVSVYDENHRKLNSEGFSSGATVNINGKEYRKVGEFQTARDGIYAFSADESGKVYVTEPTDVRGSVSGIFSGICFTFVGFIVAAVGLVGLLIDAVSGSGTGKNTARLSEKTLRPRSLPEARRNAGY